jgi:dienelactone hydrolase
MIKLRLILTVLLCWILSACDGSPITVVQADLTPKPTVILLHGCDGISNPMYRTHANTISSWGYNVVILDSFGPRGYTNICKTGQGRSVMPADRTEDVVKAIAWISQQSWHLGSIGLVGYSHGGAVALNIAQRGGIKGLTAMVSFYPSCRLNFTGGPYWSSNTPLEIHIGDQDGLNLQGIQHSCHLNDTTTNSNYHLYMYPGAYHAFDTPKPYRLNAEGYPMEYNSAVTELSYSRVRRFLDYWLHN